MKKKMLKIVGFSALAMLLSLPVLAGTGGIGPDKVVNFITGIEVMCKCPEIQLTAYSHYYFEIENVGDSDIILADRVIYDRESCYFLRHCQGTTGMLSPGDSAIIITADGDPQQLCEQVSQFHQRDGGIFVTIPMVEQMKKWQAVQHDLDEIAAYKGAIFVQEALNLLDRLLDGDWPMHGVGQENDNLIYGRLVNIQTADFVAFIGQQVYSGLTSDLEAVFDHGDFVGYESVSNGF